MKSQEEALKEGIVELFGFDPGSGLSLNQVLYLINEELIELRTKVEIYEKIIDFDKIK